MNEWFEFLRSEIEEKRFKDEERSLRRVLITLVDGGKDKLSKDTLSYMIPTD